MLSRKDLLSIERPARYSGNETNVYLKSDSKVKVHVALAFPDIYEIGESNLALKILYYILNKRKDVWAERVYVPFVDAEALMRQKVLTLTSLESGRQVNEFNLLGITLPSELCYTNILTLLNISDIPLKSEDRDLSHPIVIGGGPCASNPEPLAPFFDFFVLGDGEDVILEIIDLWLDKFGHINERRGLIESFASIDGIYVPSLYRPIYHLNGTIKGILPDEIHVPKVCPKGNEDQDKYNSQCSMINDQLGSDKKTGHKVFRRVVESLDTTPYPEVQVLSTTAAIHDRIALEIARGCTRGCRFCHAGMIYRPPRERSLERIKNLAKKLIASLGFEEVSLLSLSSGDYSKLAELLCLLRQIDPGVGPLVFSLPSLRPDGLPHAVLKRIREGRKPGFTIAPEAGSERLRSIINKNITEREILQMVEQLYLAGWDMIKLYFMVGLPGEREEDINDITRLIFEISRIGRSILKKRPRLNVTISPFVPKAHTPFQWSPQESVETVENKIRYIKGILYKHLRDKVQVKSHDPEQALIEAVLSMGDRRVGAVIENAWHGGARFDQWGEYFRPAIWNMAFQNAALDPSFYANRPRNLEEVLPWSHLNMGVNTPFLKNEYIKAQNAEQTRDCREVGCHGCGACTPDMIPKVEKAWRDIPDTEQGEKQEMISPLQRPDLGIGEAKAHIRIKFCKTGKAIYLSHLDLIRQIILAMRRAKLPLTYTQGFHPSPRIAFGPALPVGIEGEGEYLEIYLSHDIEARDVTERMNCLLPKGISFISAESIPLKSKSIATMINEACYTIYLPADFIEKFGVLSAHREKIGRIMNMEDLYIERKNKKGIKEINIRPLILGMELKDTEMGVQLFIRLKISTEQNVRPSEILKSIYGDLADEYKMDIRIIRTSLSIISDNAIQKGNNA